MFWRRLQSGFMMCFIPMGDLIDSAKPKSCVNLREEALSRRQIKTDSPKCFTSGWRANKILDRCL